MKISDSTTIQLDTKYLDERVIEDKLLELKIKYVEAISWLRGYDDIVERNNPETDGKNIEELAKQKENVETNLQLIVEKIDFFNLLKDEMKN